MQYAPFVEKQVAYFDKSMSAWLNVAEGGKRASKNILNILCYCHSLETHPDKLHLVAGTSKAIAKTTIFDSDGLGMTNYFKGRYSTGKYNDFECLKIETPVGRKTILVAGGKDSDDYKSIKGLSLGSLYATEANELHKKFLFECMDRTVASRRRKLFFDINPKSPKHWFYADFLDHQDELAKIGKNPGYNYGHFTVADNLSIPDDRLKEVLSTYDYDSMWYKVDILGKRTAASGKIYESWDKNNVATPEDIRKMNFVDFSIGVDVGGTHATVATLIGFTAGYKQAVLIDGYYHKQGKNSGMTHALYADEITSKIVGWIASYPQLLSTTLFVESADKMFRQELENSLKKRRLTRMSLVPSYKKDGILDRIRLGCSLVQSNRIIVSSHLKEWIFAYNEAVWSDKEFDVGLWVRVDDDSYSVDCLDSSEYGIHPYKSRLIAGG